MKFYTFDESNVLSLNARRRYLNRITPADIVETARLAPFMKLNFNIKENFNLKKFNLPEDTGNSRRAFAGLVITDGVGARISMQKAADPEDLGQSRKKVKIGDIDSFVALDIGWKTIVLGADPNTRNLVFAGGFKDDKGVKPDIKLSPSSAGYYQESGIS